MCAGVHVWPLVRAVDIIARRMPHALIQNATCALTMAPRRWHRRPGARSMPTPAGPSPDTNSRTIPAALSAFETRMAAHDRAASIIQENQLRREIARLETLRRTHPDVWRRLEAQRIADNREKAALNRALRAAGCPPVSMEPSLAQKRQKRQQLEARNRANTAKYLSAARVVSNKSQRHASGKSAKRRAPNV
jgi:hypothetical protein